MTSEANWVAMEDAIVRLLPPSGGQSPNRALLIQELSDYSQQLVLSARGLGPDTPGPQERDIAWLNHPVFICGHHRSGTTLLQQILDGHPQLLVLPSEGTYFSSFKYVARSNPAPQEVDRFIADWIARLIDPNQEPHFKLGRSTPRLNPYLVFARRLLGWRVVLQEARPALAPFLTLLALVAAYRDVMSASCKPVLWVEKTPLNEHNIARLAAFQEARFIQLVRDPYATLASLAQSYRQAGIPEFNSAAHARAIGRSLRLATTNTRRFAPNYLVLRYEDLTQRTEIEIQKLCAFLGICADPALLCPSVGGRAVRSNSSFEPGRLGVIEPACRPASLSAADGGLIGTVVGPAARALGYQIPRPGLLTRSAIRLAQPLAGALRLAHRLSARTRAAQGR